MLKSAMEQKLIDAQLWSIGDGCLNEQDCHDAWQVLSRLGAPYRFAGQSSDGQFEFLILHPETGNVVATGFGDSEPQAMCEAALAGREALYGVI